MPKFCSTVWETTSETIASSAETKGSFAVSSTACRICCATSLRSFRRIMRVAAAAPIAPISDRPRVNGAAACAAAISTARMTNCAITAIFSPMMSIAAASMQMAIISAPWRASSR
ncbi:hypothetical protein ABZY90_00780 [Streptomyces sp. NPDC006422]|uniref:hypothetical protein n=1 Tax=Streptomyces sp. NPDC006422 TaxID=3155457 RepID=UPI0033B29196